ncbi:MAG: hypothetical protein ACOC5G_04120 [Acidobacteriota bacterium]
MTKRETEVSRKSKVVWFWQTDEEKGIVYKKTGKQKTTEIGWLDWYEIQGLRFRPRQAWFSYGTEDLEMIAELMKIVEERLGG